ncbi:MAG: Ig-like domain-containing protein [Lachnospiraceae bacterium]|nr:Ig-like domain-containing protein [Lachnospiraceae bacterium]
MKEMLGTMGAYLKKHWHWQQTLVAAIVCVVSGALLYSVWADDAITPVLVNTGSTSYALDTDATADVSVSVTIDSNIFNGTSEELDALIAANTVWRTGNNQVGSFVQPDGTTASTLVGTSGSVKGISAGATTLYCDFYYKPNDDGTMIENVLYDGTNGADFEVVTINVASFICNINITFEASHDMDTSRVYQTGEIISFYSNSYSGDPLVVDCSNDVFTGQAESSNTGSITNAKGGKSTVLIRTQSAHQTGGGYVAGLYETYNIVGQCIIDSDSVTISDSQVNSSVDIASNISTYANADVSYESTNEEVCTMTGTSLLPKGAGTATITAGVKDADGNWMSSVNGVTTVNSEDSVEVTVPFVWTNASAPSSEITQTLNVGDSIQLTTNATSSASVVFNNYNANLISVSSSGYVTAKASGSTDIRAVITYADGSPSESITAHVNVGDTFTLSSASVSMGVNEFFDIEAILSDDTAVISFTIDGVDANAATGGLTGAVNGNVLTINAHEEGTYTVVATMEKDGITKTATCLVTVKTAVSSVTISPTERTMVVGEEAVLNVVVGPNTAYNRNVVWVSSNPEIVSVDLDTATADSATVKAEAGGQATITVVSVSDGTKYATCTIYVTVGTEGITLSESSVQVNMNAVPQYQLTATVLPENTTGYDDGVDRTVSWASTDESILTVNENGLVTFVSSGNAAVVATTSDGRYSAYCNFTVTVPVESVSITSEDLILNVGDTVSLTAEVLPLTATNRTVNWISSDPEKVTIDSNGLLTAVKAGTVTITCQAIDGGSSAPLSQISVLVRTPVSSVSLNTNSVSVPKGTVFWLYATISPSDADIKEVTWSSSDTSLATVGEDGMVTCLEAGTVTISATSKDNGDVDSCLVTITEAVTGISLSTGDSQTLFVGSQFTIVPDVQPIDAVNKKVTFTSSNEEIATVDSNGVVTAVKGGECDIIVTTEERSLTALCHITVIEYLSTITLDKTFSYVHKGGYIDLIPTTTTDTATDKSITWKTGNSAVAVVDENGRVTGTGLGKTTITALAADGGGASAVCEIQVINPITALSLAPTTLNMIQDDTYIVSASITPSDATVKSLDWTTTNSAVATVDNDGEITAVGGGKCRIIATTKDDTNLSAYVTVYVTAKTNATAITLNSTAITIDIGEVRKLNAITTPSKITEELGWYSSDTGLVTVDNNGNVTGIAEGTATVVCYGKNSNVQGTCQVTVRSKYVNANSMRLNSTEISMLTGKVRALTLRTTPYNANEPVDWYSSDTSIVTVDGTGKITTVGPGTATVTVIGQQSGVSTSVIVHSLAISKSSLYMQQYDPFQLYVDGRAEGQTVSWRTSNPRVATISSTGEVIGRKPGTTTITAVVDNKTLTCTVTIIEASRY